MCILFFQNTECFQEIRTKAYFWTQLFKEQHAFKEQQAKTEDRNRTELGNEIKNEHLKCPKYKNF